MERDYRENTGPSGMAQQSQDPPDTIAFQRPCRQAQPDNTADERSDLDKGATS